MIIGNGLIAKSLTGIDHEHCTLFCSGVSDSGETTPQAFERELNLLRAQDPGKKLVYFSTISIFNEAKKQQPYILHKINTEKKIAEIFSDFLILRLPNMIGSGGNQMNLIPYFIGAIVQDMEVTINRHASRHLLSSDLLPVIMNRLLNSNEAGIINVCMGEPVAVLEIYLYLCKLLNKTPRYTIGTEEKPFYVNNEYFNQLVVQWGMQNNFNWKKELEKLVLSMDHLSKIT